MKYLENIHRAVGNTRSSQTRMHCSYSTGAVQLVGSPKSEEAENNHDTERNLQPGASNEFKRSSKSTLLTAGALPTVIPSGPRTQHYLSLRLSALNPLTLSSPRGVSGSPRTALYISVDLRALIYEVVSGCYGRTPSLLVVPRPGRKNSFSPVSCPT